MRQILRCASCTALPARDSSILLITRVTWKKNVRRDPGYCADPGHGEMDHMDTDVVSE